MVTLKRGVSLLALLATAAVATPASALARPDSERLPARVRALLPDGGEAPSARPGAVRIPDGRPHAVPEVVVPGELRFERLRIWSALHRLLFG